MHGAAKGGEGGEGMDRMGHIVFGSRDLDSVHSCDLVTLFSQSLRSDGRVVDVCCTLYY